MQRTTVQLLSISLFFGLVIWGLWTLLIYLGVPAHTAVLFSNETNESLTALCSPNAFLCRGFYGLFPLVSHTLTRVPLFVWYTGISLLAYGALILWGYVRTSEWNLQWSMTPWKLLLLFVAMTWLIFTCISFSQNGAVSMNRIVEPRPEVYQGAGEEAIFALQKNYQSLKDRGCLTRIGTFAGTAEASEIKLRCLQGAFFTRILPPFILVVVFLFELLIAGRFVLRRLLRLTPSHPLLELAISAGLGIGAWIVLLWLGAVAHIYTAFFGWALVLAIPILCFRDAQYWLEKFLYSKWEYTVSWRSLSTLLIWFLLSYLAFNFLTVVRPFPIGWDDLGSYLNRPRLLVSYGKFVHSMQSFQWEYLTSLGFLLFGFDSIFGATSSLIINWSEGLLAVIALFVFGRLFFGPGRGVLTAALYYTLPVVGHFSFADMKIDNAVFAVGTLATLCVFVGIFREDDIRKRRIWILLGGMFAGLAFSLKVTAIMVFTALGGMLVGMTLHWLAYPAAILVALAVFTRHGPLNVPKIIEKVQWNPDIATPLLALLIFAISGGILLVIAMYLRPKKIRESIVLSLLLVGGFCLLIFPWILHNNILHGSVLGASLKAPNNLTPFIDQFGVRDPDTPNTYTLPPDLAVDQSDPHCRSSAGSEELDRYWGNHTGWGHYISLPWRSVMNIDHAGYYVTTQPAILLFPLLLLLPFFWSAKARWLRWMWAGTAFLIAQWVFFANGIPWYGIGMFLGLTLCLEALIARAPDALSRTAATLFITLSLFICLGMRFWQFESQRNLYEYAIGKISAETLRERTIPHYDDITDIVLQRNATMPDRPLLYRIGTFMPYFIPKNLEVIGITDHQLAFFNCLHQDRDNTKTLARLKALGINSIIFDTNTATIEKDPNGSLHQKVKALTDFLNSSEAGLDVVIFDPGAGIAFLLIP